MPPENEEARQAVALADLVGFCETQAPSIPDELILPRPVDAGRQALDLLVLAAALILGQGSNGSANLRHAPDGGIGIRDLLRAAQGRRPTMLGLRPC